MDKSGHSGTPIQWACAIVGAIIGVLFCARLAEELGYTTRDWQYWAVRVGAIIGGAVIGWFAGKLITKLVALYDFSIAIFVFGAV